MNPQHTEAKFAVGQPVSRKEDPRLLRGEGRFVDDINLPDQAYGLVFRSPIAHGRVHRLDLSAALTTPGVLAIYTAADMEAAGCASFPFPSPIKNHDGTPPAIPARYPLAGGKVRYVGEPLAFIVAETINAAKDAAELIDWDIEPLPALTDPVAALEPAAPQIHDTVGNQCIDWRYGDGAAVEAAFADAAHVTEIALTISRVAAVPTEPRSVLADFDPATDRFTLHLGSQGVIGMRAVLATVLNVDKERIRVLSGDVGGSFGMKSQQYPENVLVLHAARDLKRPVKWTDERTGSFISDTQGRDMQARAALALDAEGRFLALKIDMLGNLGAYPSPFGPLMPGVNIQKNAPGPYLTPLMAITSRSAYTNTVSIAPYRGAGRPEGVYVMERLIDRAARETSRDPAELRRRNLIPASAMPFTAASGLTYDSGDFATLLDKALDAADWQGCASRKSASQARGRLRGRAVTTYLEVTGPPGKELGGIRFGADGKVTILTGSHDQGQGHATTFAQLMVDRLGLPFDMIELVQDDSDELMLGGGTGGSKSTIASGNAFVQAADAVIEKGRLWAGQILEAAVEDIEFHAGAFQVAGTDRRIELRDLASQVKAEAPGTPDLPDSLDTELATDTPPSAFPNGCHVCEVEIDPDTGAVEIDRYTVVDDFGNLINPMLVEGQVHGGVVQGIGQALLEEMVLDADGQVLTGSFMDYGMPRADHIPDLKLDFHAVPATTNPLGVKGCGEAGTTGAMPCVINAVLDALAPLGVTDLDMPATPEKIWRAIDQAKSTKASTASRS